MKHAALIVIGCLFAAMGAVAQDTTAFRPELFVHRGDTLPYRILYPDNFNPENKYPVLFFLHGAGERGRDNVKQLTHGGELFLSDTIRDKFPAIIVFPQCPEGDYWSNVRMERQPDGTREFNFRTGGRPTEAMKLFLRLTKQLLAHRAVDPKRIYIGGLSMGAMGTYEALRRKPGLFAAAFAICGGDHTSNVRKYRHVPLWIFHGELDDVVPSTHSHVLVTELNRLGAEPRKTFYPKANHNSWDAAFAEPELLPWLFSHTKN